MRDEKEVKKGEVLGHETEWERERGEREVRWERRMRRQREEERREER